MCGIAGIISAYPIDMCIAKKMNEKLIHRGPDGYGYLSSGKNFNIGIADKVIQLDPIYNTHFIFTHRRLAIHDLSNSGHQPMSYLNRYWLVFNGEIYNFIELRAELETNGYRFYSQTDSEIILAAYDFWGIDCLKRFNGDWAIVLLDTVRQTILISRDRFGIKPLYYFSKPDLFIFASEIKAILEHPSVPKEPNLNYLKNYVEQGPIDYEKETSFQQIFNFQFSAYFEDKINATLEPDNIKSKQFWSFATNDSTELLKEDILSVYIKQYYALLEDAVRIRLRGDVKIGANLSGGLDSSSIVYLIYKVKQNFISKNPLETFSSIYRTKGTEDCDESFNITEISQLLKFISHYIEPKVEEIPIEHRKMIYHLEIPPESTLMSSWYTAKLINQSKVRISLTGEGADEQLAGYLRYIAYFFANMNWRNVYTNYHLFRTIPGAQRYIQVGLIAKIIQTFFGKKITQFFFSKTGRKENIFTPVNGQLKKDILKGLVNLHRIDEHVFMAFSIELRAPFMDYRLVEFLASVPMAYKLAKGNTKYLARQAFNNILPKSINWNKNKLGWPIPERFWFEGQLKEWMKTTIEHSNFLKQQDFFSINLKNASLTKKIRLLNLAVWHEVFFHSHHSK